MKSNVQNPENVLFQFFRTRHALRFLMAEVVEGTGITADEYGVLGVIAFLGPLSPTELARRTGVPPTTLSRYLANFTERGFTVRRRNEVDGRSYLVEATAKGQRIARTIGPRIRAAIGELRRHSAVPLPEVTAALAELEDAARSLAEERGRRT